MEALSRSSSDVLLQLGEALEPEGSFPVRARIIERLREEAASPRLRPERVSALLISDPVLCARVLHILNSPSTRRSDSLLSIRQGCEELGPKAVVELCQRMVVAQSFSQLCRRSECFRNNLTQSILIALLTEALSERWGGETGEIGKIAGMLYGLGPLMLGFYFPQVYQAAAERAERRDLSVSQSIRETLGIPPFGISIGLVHFLHLPDFYRETIAAAYNLYTNRNASDVIPPSEGLARAVAAAGWLSDILCHYPARLAIEPELQEACDCFQISSDKLTELLERMPSEFSRHCRENDLHFLDLPVRLEEVLFGKEAVALTGTADAQLAPYLENIQTVLRTTRSVPCAATYALEALIYALQFDRALVLLSDESCRHLYGTIALGASFDIPPRLIAKKIAHSGSTLDPVQRAFADGVISTSGRPLFSGAQSFAVLPIGQGDNSIGVIYAERITGNQPQGGELDRRIVRGLRLLTDSLHSVVHSHL